MFLEGSCRSFLDFILFSARAVCWSCALVQRQAGCGEIESLGRCARLDTGLEMPSFGSVFYI